MPGLSVAVPHLSTMTSSSALTPVFRSVPVLSGPVPTRLEAIDHPGAAPMAEIWSHYERLDETSLRRRFFTSLSRDGMARRATRDHPDFICVLRDTARIVRGVASAYRTGRSGEIAFSIEVDWRGMGLGKRLAERARHHAALHDFAGLEAVTSSDNAAMIGLARAVGGTIRYAGAETYLDLPPAAPQGAGRALHACRRDARKRIDTPVWAAVARGSAGRPDTPVVREFIAGEMV